MKEIRVPQKRSAGISVPSFRIHVDGAGQRPDGAGSGYARYNETTGEQRAKRVDGLTNNEAEYRGLIYALLNVPRGSELEIFSDSQLMVNQFCGNFAVRNPNLASLLKRAREIIQERQLTVTLTWVPREQNLAGRLLDRK